MAWLNLQLSTMMDLVSVCASLSPVDYSIQGQFHLGAKCSSVVGHLFMVQWVVGLILHGGPIEPFIIPAIVHNWHSKGFSMCCPVRGMVHIKDPLLLIAKSSPCGSNRFSLSLSECAFTICPKSYIHK